MKRKLLLAVLGAATAATMAFGLAACGELPDGNDELWSMERVYAAAQDLGFTGTLDELIAMFKGDKGDPGADGIGIADIFINEDGELLIKLTNGEELNCGVVRGEQGPQGEQGEPGEQGPQGPAGSDSSAHEHTYGDWQTVLSPTCTSIGYNMRECMLCGDVDYQFTEATGHTLGRIVQYEKEMHAQVCTTCGGIVYELHTLGEDGVCTTCFTDANASLDLAFGLNAGGESYSVTGLGGATGDIVVPATYMGKPVTGIADYAFHDRLNVTSIVVKGEVEIGNYAFAYAYNVGSITLLGGATAIGEYAFAGTSIAEFTIPENVTCIEDGTFSSCTSLASIVIPDSVTSIGSRAFNSCDLLANVTIPDHVTCIGRYAFGGCYSLTEVTIPESVTSIEYGVFADCRSLTSVVIPDGVTYIASDAFYRCTSLTSVTIPESVTSIGNYVFGECEALEEIVYPGTMNAWWHIFKEDNWHGWQNFVITCTDGTIPPDGTVEFEGLRYAFNGEGLTVVGYNAMLSELVIPAICYDLPVTAIGSNAFVGCGWLTSVTLPESVTSIEPFAFDYCSNLTNIDLSNVTFIGDYAFGACNNLTSVDFTGAAYIGDYAFQWCNGLTNITLGENIAWIGYQAFASCGNLHTVTFNSAVPPQMGGDIFADVWNAWDFAIYVPEGSLEAYRAVDDYYWQIYVVQAGKLYDGTEPELPELDHAGTFEDPFTIANVLEIGAGLDSFSYYLDEAGNRKKIYVHGYVVDVGYESKAGEVGVGRLGYVYIADTYWEGMTKDSQWTLCIYSLTYDETYVKNSSDLAEGDEVIIWGYIENYNGTTEITYDPTSGDVATCVWKDPVYDATPDDTNYGSLENPLTVTEALALATEQCVNSGDATNQIVFMKGVVAAIGSISSYYKNVYIADENDSGMQILVYTVNLRDGITAPEIGDIVIISGYIKNYNGMIEFASNGSTYVYFERNLSDEEELNPQPELPKGEHVTLSFDDETKRTTGVTDQTEGLQVWEDNGITFTNSGNVNTQYFAPVRIYKSSSVKIEYTGMTAIVFYTVAKYADVEGCFAGMSGLTVKTYDLVVVVEFDSARDSFEFTASISQLRFDSIDVYKEVSSEGITLTFDDTAKRTAFSEEEQVWEENGIKFTNSKGGAASNVADFAKPVRIYKGSTVKIEYTGMTAIVFHCNSEGNYATSLINSLAEVEGIFVTVDGNDVTVTFAEATDSFEFVASNAQTRFDSIEVKA